MSKPKRALKKIPAFKSEAAERKFLATSDSTEYVDWAQARLVRFPKLRPSSTTDETAATRPAEDPPSLP